MKCHTENIKSDNLRSYTISNPHLKYQYQAEGVKNKLIEIFKRKHTFTAWKEIAISKRIDFPYDFYNRRLQENALRAFKIALRSKLIKQRNLIKVEVYKSKKNDRLKGKIFISLLQNIYNSKKKRWKNQTVENFRSNILLNKAFKAWKLDLIYYKSSSHYPTNLSSQRFDSSSNVYKIQESSDNYYYPTQSQNPTSQKSPSENNGVYVSNDKSIYIQTQNDYTQSRFTQNSQTSPHTGQVTMSNDEQEKDMLLDQIYKRYMSFKSRKIITRCFVAWKYHVKYEKSIAIDSIKDMQTDEKYNVTHSSFLNLSSSNQDRSLLNSSLDEIEHLEIATNNNMNGYSLHPEDLYTDEIPLPSPHIPRPVDLFEYQFKDDRDLRMHTADEAYDQHTNHITQTDYSMYRNNYNQHNSRLNTYGDERRNDTQYSAANKLFHDLEQVIKRRKNY